MGGKRLPNAAGDGGENSAARTYGQTYGTCGCCQRSDPELIEKASSRQSHGHPPASDETRHRGNNNTHHFREGKHILRNGGQKLIAFLAKVDILSLKTTVGVRTWAMELGDNS
jgi:hypothetical protein